MAESATTKPKPRARVVVVDDEEEMGRILEKILAMEHYEVRAFSRPLEAIDHIRKNPPDLVLTDMKMPDATGLDVLKATRETSPETAVVVMTAYGTIEGGVEAMRGGAFDYITKPWKMDELLLTLGKALEQSRLLRENETLAETIRRQEKHPEIIGQSEPLAAVMDMVRRVAPTDAAVLITGESGTGKELIARAVHLQSPRKSKRFVAINCASIPENLLESELFGHEKGSFTGADRRKLGMVELAHEGTLFLDEIGELPMALQAKILRTLQEREIQRVGGTQAIPVDIRLVAATNRDLQQAMEAREFRQDLYFRLNVITIHLPPLRERRDDIPVLAKYFLEKAAPRIRKRDLRWTPAALDALAGYAFPGNVRELENLVERVVVMCEHSDIEPADLPAEVREGGRSGLPPAGPPGSGDYREAKEQFERQYMLAIIEAAGGNMSEAARVSGLSRRHLYEKLERLGIKPDR